MTIITDDTIATADGWLLKNMNKRKKIQVNYIATHWIAGKEDSDFWYCQHPETHSEKVENEVMPIEVCDDCNAYYDSLYDEWRDETLIEVKRLVTNVAR